MNASVGTAAPRAVLLNGNVGAGKTTTGQLIGQLLRAADVPGAFIDLDALRDCWPATPSDPFNNDAMFANLSAVAQLFVARGMTSLILAGVVEDRAERAKYAAAIGVMPVFVRLVASNATLQRRVTERAATPGERDWHVDRVPTLAALLAAADVDDWLVDTDDRPAEQVAADILARLGWTLK